MLLVPLMLAQLDRRRPAVRTAAVMALAGALLVAWFVLPPLFNWLHHQPLFSPRIASSASAASRLM